MIRASADACFSLPRCKTHRFQTNLDFLIVQCNEWVLAVRAHSRSSIQTNVEGLSWRA
jgi:hypothetical protein